MIRIALDRSWPGAIRALRDGPAFRMSLAERLRAVPREAWFWECIRASDGPFECIATRPTASRALISSGIRTSRVREHRDHRRVNAHSISEIRSPSFIFWVAPIIHGSLQTVMRNRYDQLAKQIGKVALETSGRTVVHAEIAPEPLHADLLHEPDPTKAAERKRLGLLGRLVALPCLLEPYSGTPSAEEFRACLTKHLAWWQQRARQQRADGRQSGMQGPRRKLTDPFLWILCGGSPSSILTKLTLKATSEWPAGVYLFGDDVLRVGFIVASELPRERTTLLVRLMAAGPALPHAIEELYALPPDAFERSAAERPLLHFHRAVEQQPTRTPDEQEFLNTMLKTWAETRNEGRSEGRIETRAEDILTVLRMRGIAVPTDARKRILAQKDLKQLQRWHERAVVVESVDDLFKSRS